VLFYNRNKKSPGAYLYAHRNDQEGVAKDMLQKSHAEVMKLAESFSNEELFSKGIYKWVGGSSLGSYFVSVTSSHYDWAMKKLKAHKKMLPKYRV
jgi:hypothetical protein